MRRVGWAVLTVPYAAAAVLVAVGAGDVARIWWRDRHWRRR